MSPLKTARVRRTRRKIFQSSEEPTLILVTAQTCSLRRVGYCDSVNSLHYEFMPLLISQKNQCSFLVIGQLNRLTNEY